MSKEKKRFLAPLLLAGVGLACGTAGEVATEGEAGSGATARSNPAIVLPVGTELQVRLNTGLNSKDNKAGDTFSGVLNQAVVAGEKVAIPKGADVKGRVTKTVPSGRLKQRAELWVTLTSVSVGGRSYQVSTDTAGHEEGSKTKRNILFIGGGSGTGAAIGGATGGGKGAGIGAAIGAGAGTAAAMLTGKREVKFPAETVLAFQLEEALRVRR
ncbi:MAG: hypothetical protein ACE5HB_03055 [Terriglobia bacterium]